MATHNHDPRIFMTRDYLDFSLKQILIMENKQLNDENNASSFSVFKDQDQLSLIDKLKYLNQNSKGYHLDLKKKSYHYDLVVHNDEIVNCGQRNKEMAQRTGESYSDPKSFKNSQKSRDEILLEMKNVYLSLNHIVESNSSEFNRILTSMDFDVDQLILIKDIRRRAKNKIAAQICRKRKIDSIESLAEDVEFLNKKQLLLEKEEERLENEITKFNIKFNSLADNLQEFDQESNKSILLNINRIKQEFEDVNSLQVDKLSEKSFSESMSEPFESTSPQSVSDSDSTYNDEPVRQSSYSNSFYIENLIKLT